MKDPRFVDEANWTMANERGRARGETLFRELGDPTVVLAAVGALLGEAPDAGGAELEVPATLVEDVTRFVDGLDVREDGAWFAIARGLASVAVGCVAPTPQRLMEAASRLERAPQWVHHAFHEECLALLEGLGAETREAWLAASTAPPRVPIAEPRPRSQPIDVARQEAKWQVVDPFELWDEHGAAIPLVAAYEPLNLLRRFDAQRWFHTVDAWDDGRLVFAALFGSHVRHDREALLRYLSVAAPVFDESGVWTGRTAALVLAQSVIEHASALANAVRGARDVGDAERDAAVALLAEEELPAYFTSAWHTLIARTDGLAIAAALHVRLSEPPAGGIYHVDVPAIALRSLSGCLKEVAPSSARLRTLWRLRRDAHEGAGRSRYVSALRAFASAVSLAKTDEPFDPELFDWLAELLRGDASEWRYFASGGSLPPLLERVAELLAQNLDATAKLEALYASFEPGRRRGEFGRTHAENDADLASIVLIVLLVRVVDGRYAAGAGDEAIDVAARLFSRALRLFLVSSPAFEATLSARAALTVAIELRVRVNRRALPECLGAILSDPGCAAEVAAALLVTTGRDELEMAIAPTYGNLLELQARSQEWAAATDLPRDRRAADALATALRTPTKLDELAKLSEEFGDSSELKK